MSVTSSHPSLDAMEWTSATTGINDFEEEYEQDYPRPKKPIQKKGESRADYNVRYREYSNKVRDWNKDMRTQYVREQFTSAGFRESELRRFAKESKARNLAAREQYRLETALRVAKQQAAAKLDREREELTRLKRLAANEAATAAQFKTAAGKELVAAKEAEKALKKAKAEAAKTKAKLDQAEKDKVDAEKLKESPRGKRLAARTEKKGGKRRHKVTHRRRK